MILALVSDPTLRTALRRAASPEEDVLWGDAVAPAMRGGFPRLLVHDDAAAEEARRLLSSTGVAVIGLDAGLLGRWDEQRRADAFLRTRAEHAALHLRLLVRESSRPGWVDLAFRDLSRSAGAALPPPFRGFARRVMEYPARYGDLHGVGALAGLSRGALKARFRRRGMESPAVYVRWLRCFAVAHVMRDPSITTLQATHRLGFTSDGNLCRTLRTTTGLTPKAFREPEAWNRLVLGFTKRLMDPDALEAWHSLESLFLRRAA